MIRFTSKKNPLHIDKYFPSGGISRATAHGVRRTRVIQSQWTSPRRYPAHLEFLEKHRQEIRAFADIGPGNFVGAPTTYEAKAALGPGSVVHAVDVKKLNTGIAAIFAGDNNLKVDDITPLLHSISRKPLPLQCDAIRLANVTNWISKAERDNALQNVWKSLRLGGYLLGAYAGREFVFRKTSEGFEIL